MNVRTLPIKDFVLRCGEIKLMIAEKRDRVCHFGPYREYRDSSVCHLCPAGLLKLSRGTFKLVPRDKLKVPRDKLKVPRDNFKSPATFKNTPYTRCIILLVL